MPEPGFCPTCGGLLATRSTAGSLCAACLLALGLPDVRTWGSYRAGSLAEYLHIVNVVAESPRACVYLGQWRLPGSGFVALKRLNVPTPPHADGEAQALRLVELDHPHVAPLFDVGRDAEGRPYTVTEYVPGTPLPEYCDNEVHLGECVELFRQVADTLAYLHAHGVFHLNLKPSNVLVMDPPIGVQLLDFAAALPRAASSPSAVEADGPEPDIRALGSLLWSWLSREPGATEIHAELRRISRMAGDGSRRGSYGSIQEMATDLGRSACLWGAQAEDRR